MYQNSSPTRISAGLRLNPASYVASTRRCRRSLWPLKALTLGGISIAVHKGMYIHIYIYTYIYMYIPALFCNQLQNNILSTHLNLPGHRVELPANCLSHAAWTFHGIMRFFLRSLSTTYRNCAYNIPLDRYWKSATFPLSEFFNIMHGFHLI